MYKIFIVDNPLWTNSGRKKSEEVTGKRTQMMSSRNLDDYAVCARDARCCDFYFMESKNDSTYIAIDSLLKGIRNGDIHIVNPETLTKLIKKSSFRNKRDLIDSLTLAIQLGDYKDAPEGICIAE